MPSVDRSVQVKQRGYILRVQPGRVSVEYRASVRGLTTALLSFAYLGYCFVPPVRKALADFYSYRDPVIGGFALVMLLLPLFFKATWLIFTSGEVMHCDARELHFARRRTLGRWHRSRFSSARIRGLTRALRGGGKARSFTVLTFQVDGKQHDMLEDLTHTDAERVLIACKSIGVDVVMPNPQGAAMLRDIDKRGWWINPLRPDHDGKTSEKHGRPPV